MNNQIIKNSFSYIFFGMCILFFGFKSFGAQDQQNEPNYSREDTKEGKQLSTEEIYNIIRSLDKKIEDQDKKIEDQDKKIEDQDKKIEDRDKKIENQEKEVAAKINMLTETIATQEVNIAKLTNNLKKKGETIKQLNTRITDMEQSLEAKDRIIVELRKKIKKKDETIASLKQKSISGYQNVDSDTGIPWSTAAAAAGGIFSVGTAALAATMVLKR